MTRYFIAVVAIATTAFACAPAGKSDATKDETDKTVAVAAEPDEPHLINVRQATFGGENAEAYWSTDSKWITFQSTRDGRKCDQQYVMRANGSDLRKISVGGKTTCGFFYDDNRRVLFASTHAVDTACPPKPDASAGYVWPLESFDIYTAAPDGADLKRLTNYGAYTAEAVVSPDGQMIVFTSLKDGDLDIYTMRIDGTDVRRLTNTLGYDGGAWWSPDGKRIVYRSHHPANAADSATYKSLLAQKLVKPSKVELFIMNADGSDQHQITHLGGANFGPSWTPDGKQIVFSSNYLSPRSGNFDLFLVNDDGTGLTQLTKRPEFDGFPMFSPDGKYLLWASNRHEKTTGETNLFIAEWVK